MATQETENPLPTIKNKTWILKTSIHCEGCKRKVKKILCQVNGVENVEVDIKQQKVIVTGNVDGYSLVKKLNKAGKNAELLPQKVEKKEKNSGQWKNKEKQAVTDSNEQKIQENGGAKREQKAEVKVEVVQNPSKTSDGGASTSGGGSGSTAEDGGEVKSNEHSDIRGSAKVSEAPVKTGGSVEVAESKSEEKKKPESSSASAPPPVAEEKGNNESKSGVTSEKSNGNSAGGVESGTSGKKKKKQGQNGNECAKSSVATPACTGSEKHHAAGPPPISTPANHIPPRQHGYHDYPPPHHHYGPPPVCAVSYNTAYPTSSYTASYYKAPPPYSYAYSYPGQEMQSPQSSDQDSCSRQPLDSYAYSYPGQEMQSPPPSDQDSYPRQPLDSFEMFSDENPNGCFIM